MTDAADTITRLTGEVERLTRHIDELTEKFTAKCACSLDAPGEVCAGHSPQIGRLTARVAELEGALRFYADGSNWTNPFGMSSILNDGGRVARAVLSASQPAPSPWRPTHRHVKRGSTYQVVGEAALQTSQQIYDYEPLTIYRADDGIMWARPTSEFNDGRFETLPPPPQKEGE